ncbi:guanylate kinase [Chlorobium sp. BLA1]|uniref:guanylate kinase n=1 Tax=Candidatus Chlorobium masyuteum TaxID=2716876 RepID=UPI0014225AB9|nr:guanylate kinase [Candidatus Chlorobium masyuteum]NHQ59910.1 guanylate kinase [Candidatus Chlorobium masyuteum]NTU44758.1 guanylate kinase [Chlorobiaceae bacterium]
MVEERKRQGKLIVFSAPSGTGKSTIAKQLLERIPDIRFSVSATTREKRVGEVEGINYYFLSKNDFEEKIRCGGFIEHEFFFGNHYGTLLDKTREVIESGSHLLLDLDVKGALNLKRLFPENSLLIFFKPPSMEILEARLKGRESEDEESLKLRLERARLELEYAERFDEVIVNDNLDLTVETVTEQVRKFLL